MKTLVMKLLAITVAATLYFGAGPSAMAQDAAAEAPATGLQTLDDILRRQGGENVPRVPNDATRLGGDNPEEGPLGSRGVLSDSDLWLRAREGQSLSTSLPDRNSAMLVQDEGAGWLTRRGELSTYTLYALGGALAILALVLLLKGRIKIQSGWSAVKIERFTFIERFGHWLLATSFIILAITGLGLLLGREYVIPGLDWFHAQTTSGPVDPDYGKNGFAAFAIAGKWAHNNISWAFMVALVLIFFMWVLRNIPTWTDIKWLASLGGAIGKGHPHARKFNGGQKVLFWAVIILGGSISASGISLLQPYEYPMFAATFDKINAAGAALGFAPGLNTAVTPIQEMQYAQWWHTVVSIVLMVIIVAHIYIGSIGMQGAFQAMGNGKVDLNWAREHHDLWVAKLEKQGRVPRPNGVSNPQTRSSMPMNAPRKPTVPAE